MNYTCQLQLELTQVYERTYLCRVALAPGQLAQARAAHGHLPPGFWNQQATLACQLLCHCQLLVPAVAAVPVSVAVAYGTAVVVFVIHYESHSNLRLILRVPGFCYTYHYL